MSSNEHPDMSGSGVDIDPDRFNWEQIEDAFRAGAQQMREMLARFVEEGGSVAEKKIASSMRLNWVPSWGKDPGKPEDVYANIDQAMP
jgi:hypothetical protein